MLMNFQAQAKYGPMSGRPLKKPRKESLDVKDSDEEDDAGEGGGDAGENQENKMSLSPGGAMPVTITKTGKVRILTASDHIHVYRVSQLADLGLVDLDFECWWAATAVSYCTSRLVEHPRSKSPNPG